MAAPTLPATFAHAGNPTTAPTITFGTTAANDILLAAFTNGGSDADPTISGTTISTGGLTWTKVLSVGGGALTDMNGSVWWARATGNHTGQTVIAATTNSGAAVGAQVVGAMSNGTPTEVVASVLNASGVNALVGAAPSVDQTLLLLFLFTDDNIASDTVTATGTPTPYGEVQDAASSGGVDTAVALYSATGTTASTGTLTWNNARGAGIYQAAILVAVKPPVVVSATLAAPIGALSATAAAIPQHPATLNAPLGGLTAAMSATVEAGTSTVEAVLAAPLGALASTATATTQQEAVLAAPLGSLAASSSSTVEHSATAAAPLGALSATVAATPEHPATIAAPLGALAATGSATVEHAATLTAPLGQVTATITTEPTVEATLTATLGTMTAVTAATIEHPATMSGPLGALTSTVLAGTEHPAVLVAVLGSLTAAADATVEPPAQGQTEATLTAPLGQLSASATGSVTHQAWLIASLGQLTAMVDAGISHSVSVAAPLGDLGASLTGVTTQLAVLEALLGSLTAEITISAAVTELRTRVSGIRPPHGFNGSEGADASTGTRPPHTFNGREPATSLSGRRGSA